jgi:hypothetical protein
MTKTPVLTALLLASLAACATTDDDAALPTHEMSPVATFASRTGTTIELYALRSGYSALERGPSSLPRALSATDVASLSPSQLYVQASGSTDVPAAVTALSAQIGASDRPDAIVGPRYVREPQITEALNGCSSSAFQSGGYCPSGDVDWCLLNWWDGAYEYIGSTWYSSSYLCSKQGSVLWQIQNGEGGFHQWTVNQGELYHYYLYDGLDTTWLHYDVLHASGNEFQFGGMAYH